MKRYGNKVESVVSILQSKRLKKKGEKKGMRTRLKTFLPTPEAKLSPDVAAFSVTAL